MKYTRRKLLLALVIAFVALGFLLLYPWKRVVVAPAMRVRVVDEAGNPARWSTVKQEYEYRVIGSRGHEAITVVDENGYASFPERTERVSLIRLIPSFARELVHLRHGYGFGSLVTIWAYGTDPYDWTFHPFSWDKTFPEEMRLIRRTEPKYPHESTWPRQ